MPPVLLNDINSCLKHNSFSLEEREMGVLDVTEEDRQKREMKESTTSKKGRMQRRESMMITSIKIDRFFI